MQNAGDNATPPPSMTSELESVGDPTRKGSLPAVRSARLTIQPAALSGDSKLPPGSGK